jgi:hypothetical protein
MTTEASAAVLNPGHIRVLPHDTPGLFRRRARAIEAAEDAADVAAAREALSEGGERVTLEEIRAALGAEPDLTIGVDPAATPAEPTETPGDEQPFNPEATPEAEAEPEPDPAATPEGKPEDAPPAAPED